jgi:hypothetical protein
LLSGFKGAVRLVHGSESGVCTAKEVKDLQREFPKAQVLEVAGAAHPVPFNAAVNNFVLKSLGLPAKSAPKAQPTTALTQMDMALEPGPVWQEPTLATDAPVAVLASLEVMAPQAQPIEAAVVMPIQSNLEPTLVATPAPQDVVLPVPVQPPSLWAWFKRQLRGTTKK